MYSIFYAQSLKQKRQTQSFANEQAVARQALNLFDLAYWPSMAKKTLHVRRSQMAAAV